jgi:hypothetical protein
MGNSDPAIPVIAGLAVGIAFVLSFAFMADNPAHFRSYGHSGAAPASWYLIQDKISDLEVRNPEATVKKGTALEVIKDVPIVLVAEKSDGMPAVDDPLDPTVLPYDNGVSFSMYYENNEGVDMVAITIENISPDDIAVFALGIQGFIKVEIPETGASMEVNTVYRPVISDRYDVGRPPITSPYWIISGDSLTAYFQDSSLNADRYSAEVCYSYDLSDRSGGSNYCIILSEST